MKAWNKIFLLVILAVSQLLSSCGTESGNPSDIQGRVVMGSVNAATVTLYQLDSQGNIVGTLAQTTTTSEGVFEFQSISASGPILVVSTGGSYTDEATGDGVTISDDFELRAVVADVSQLQFVGINAFTTITARRVLSNQQQNMNGFIAEVQLQVQQMFGLEEVDIVQTDPSDLTVAGHGHQNASDNTTQLGAMVAIFTQLAASNGLTASEVLSLLDNIAADYSDGTFDGLQNGEALPNNLSITPLQTMQGLSDAKDDFLNGPKNKSGHNGNSFQFQFQSPPT